MSHACKPILVSLAPLVLEILLLFCLPSKLANFPFGPWSDLLLFSLVLLPGLRSQLISVRNSLKVTRELRRMESFTWRLRISWNISLTLRFALSTFLRCTKTRKVTMKPIQPLNSITDFLVLPFPFPSSLFSPSFSLPLSFPQLKVGTLSLSMAIGQRLRVLPVVVAITQRL